MDLFSNESDAITIKIKSRSVTIALTRGRFGKAMIGGNDSRGLENDIVVVLMFIVLYRMGVMSAHFIRSFDRVKIWLGWIERK